MIYIWSMFIASSFAIVGSIFWHPIVFERVAVLLLVQVISGSAIAICETIKKQKELKK